MVKGRMDWDPKNGSSLLGSAVTSGKAVNTPAFMSVNMQIMSSMIN